MSDFDHYLSPFSWRYASPEMREVWSETHKRRLWRKIWTCLAKVQSEYGLVQPEQVEDLEKVSNDVNVERALEIEAEISHDLMAELTAFCEMAPIGKSIVHLGATAMDIEDNADAIRLRQALTIILDKLDELLLELAEKITLWADTPMIAFTHLQPAEPSTLGYRLASYAQDLLSDRQQLYEQRDQIRGKGFKGAVGTAASYIELIGAKNLEEFENKLSEMLDVPFYRVTTQTYPRKQDYVIVSKLSCLGSSLYKFAFDLRVLQTPMVGEISEPFGENQIGSSAMPFKRNPVTAERIDSLARLLSQMPQTAWNNAAHSLLERTLDESANRRVLLPESFLITDQILQDSIHIVRGLKVSQMAILHNLQNYAPFASTERVLMRLVKAGADRQEMHARLRDHAMSAWNAIQQGNPNPLVNAVLSDPVFLEYIPVMDLESLMLVEGYTGIAPKRALEMARTIRRHLSDHPTHPGEEIEE